jgi:phospho-N-acetylmuramoyl-pentapeptide-transferase
MILLLLELLKSLYFKIPTVFFYTSTRMILAAMTSLLISILCGPRFIKKLYELKIGQTIRTDECPLLGSLHRNKNNTPTMGGLLILFSVLVSLLLWMDFSSIYTWIFFLVIFFFGFIGGYDDYLKLKYRNTKGLRAKKKMLLQVIFSSLIASYFLFTPVTDLVNRTLHVTSPVVKEEVGKKQVSVALNDYMTRLYIPFMKGPVAHLGIILALGWIAFVITGSSNAANLTDGLDGLAAGCLMMSAGVFALIAFLSNNIEMASYLNILYIEGSGEIAIFLLACIGALLGFLWYNGHPAQLFMGDIGSLTLGAILGVSAIMLRKEVLLALVGGVFVMETLSVIIQVVSFKWRGQRVFLCSPLHHHFEYLGWPETKVVTRFWIVALLLAFFGLATLKFQ